MNLLSFFILAGLWGGSFVAIKFVLEHLDPFWSVFLRALSACLFICAFFLLKKENLKLPLRSMMKSAICGVFAISIPFSLLFWGEQYISAGIAGVINGTVPMFVLLLARFGLKSSEDWQLNKVIGIALGIAGLVFIFYPKLQIKGDILEVYGIIAVILMSVSYAIASVMNRYVIYKDEKITFGSNLVYQNIFAVLFLIPLLFFVPVPSLEQFNSESVLGILYLGVLSTGTGYLLFYRLLKVWSPVKATAVTYVVPVVALGLDFLIYESQLDWFEATGALMIFFGVVVTQYQKGFIRKLLHRPPAQNCKVKC